VLTAVVLAVSLFTVAQSTSDGDEGEGGGDLCEHACLDADTLQFCDAGTVTTLSCGDVAEGAVCGFHSDRQGFDCLLPAAAACDPSYAFGLSRCVPPLFCTDRVCTTTAPPAVGVATPTAGTAAPTTASTSSCGSCAHTDARVWTVLLTPALLLRWRRRRG
jgi:hypothetical protein